MREREGKDQGAEGEDALRGQFAGTPALSCLLLLGPGTFMSFWVPGSTKT